MRARFRNGRRATTYTELLVGVGIFAMSTTLLVGLVRFSYVAWHTAEAERDSTQVLALAIDRIAPSVRGALRVDVAESTSTRLTVVVPAVDGGGQYALPLADGDRHAFYLSDTTGATGNTGTILWRSVNGTPDSSWSLRSGTGRVDLGTAGLTFTYNPTGDPESVRISVVTSQHAGLKTISRTATSEIFLRNHSDP